MFPVEKKFIVEICRQSFAVVVGENAAHSDANAFVGIEIEVIFGFSHRLVVHIQRIKRAL